VLHWGLVQYPEKSLAMKFAICNETFVDWPHERAFAFAREVGYTGIEIAPFTFALDVREITPAQRADVRRLAERTGLEVVGLHWLLAKTKGYYLTSPDAAVRRTTSEYVRELARCCREMGGSIMVFGSPLQRNLLPGVTLDEAMNYAADVFRAAMPTLEELDVTLAVEPLGPAEGDFLLTAAEGRKLCAMVGSPNCRLHLDVKAMSSEGRPIEGIIREQADLMAHFHANDANKLGPGMGQIDFHPIFAALAEVNYQGWVSVEVFDYSPGPEYLARESLANMQRVLADLGAG